MDLHRPVDPNKTLEEMTPEEKLRYEHQRLHALHSGHEAMHTSMVFVLIGTLIVAQVVVVEWKRRHQRSYARFTMVAMWAVPVVLSARSGWWRFVSVWTAFTAATAFVARRSAARPLAASTPRLTYKWFLATYKLSCWIGATGYVLLVATLLGANVLVGQRPAPWLDAGLTLLFYGLYFGVLGRDVAEWCSERVAAGAGYYAATGLPTRRLEPGVCAACGAELLVAPGQPGVIENTCRLACGHVFHEWCIRGWCIVGKKQSCPYCRERVDLKRMFTNPWDRPHLAYAQLLDWVRWLVAWQPLVLFLAQAVNWLLGLE